MTINLELRRKIVAMFRDEATYLEIAAACGLTRSVVAGHITRARQNDPTIPNRKMALHLEALDRANARRAEHRKAREAKNAIQQLERLAAGKPLPAPVAPVDAHVGALAIAGLGLKDRCCWPLGDPLNADFRYCCEPCTGTYCPEHHKVAHVGKRGFVKNPDHVFKHKRTGLSFRMSR